MKKLFRGLLMALMVLCALTLVGCKKDDPKLTDQDVVNAAKEALTINYTEVTTNFTLPTTAAGGVTVSWASNADAIVISGQNATVTRPTFEEGNKSVTLTATLAKGEASATKDFTVVVVKQEDVNTIEALTVAEAVTSEQGATVTVRGIVSGFHYSLYNDAPSIQACYITDATGTVYVYGFEFAQAVQKGDDVVLEAVVGEYNGYIQLTKPTLVQEVSSGNEIPTEGAKTDKTVADIAADLAGNYTACAYLFEGVQIKKITGSSYINYVVEDADGNAINLYSGANSVEFGWLDEYLGKEVKVLFAINSQNSAKTKWRGHVLDVVEVVGDWAGGNGGGGASTTATVSEILAAAASLADGAKLAGDYKTTGTVTEITNAYDASYGNVSFKLSDGTNEILCYRTYGDLAASVAVGDTVTVVGEVQNYSGTIEFVYADVTERTAGTGGGNVNPNPNPNPDGTVEATVSEVLDATASLAQGSTTTTVYITTGTVTGITEQYNSQYGNIGFYLSDGTKEILVYRATGVEAANLAKGDTVTVQGKIQNYNGTIEFVQVEITARTAGNLVEEQADAVITFGDTSNRLSQTTTQQVWAQNGITVTNNKSASTSNIIDSSNPVRFYKNSELVIEYTSNIAKIVITTPGGNYCYSGTETLAGATLTVSGGVMTIVLDTPATSFTISALAIQTRASQIEIFVAE